MGIAALALVHAGGTRRFVHAGVSDTIQRVSDLESESCWACGQCNSKLTLFMLAMAMALLAAAVFLVLSSVTSMPVSTTHVRSMF